MSSPVLVVESSARVTFGGVPSGRKSLQEEATGTALAVATELMDLVFKQRKEDKKSNKVDGMMKKQLTKPGMFYKSPSTGIFSEEHQSKSQGELKWDAIDQDIKNTKQELENIAVAADNGIIFSNTGDDMNGNLFGPQAVVTFGCTILDFFLNMNGTQNVRSSEKEKSERNTTTINSEKTNVNSESSTRKSQETKEEKSKVGQETLKTQKSNLARKRVKFMENAV